MKNKLKERENYPTLVIHSTDNSFGFGYRKKNNLESDKLFIKKFDNDPVSYTHLTLPTITEV